ncbi:MAG: KUP/HAK/KT family potassium transporter [candidate division WOR-3 bacterium]
MKKFLFDVFKPLGIVFGDIGTSPIYTMTLILLILKSKTVENIMGIASLIIWSLIIMVSIQYAFLSMKFSLRGEGGKIILSEYIQKTVNNSKIKNFSKYFLFVGLAFFVGDGILTPSISILSAVEGIRLINVFENIPQSSIIIISSIIAFVLFYIQRNGVDKIFPFFSPIIFIWFLLLLFFGIINILKFPKILFSLNPYYAIEFFLNNGLEGFLVLSLVILSVTGGEALYSDMGHVGKDAIRRSWFFFVFPCLVINYLGQASFAINNPHSVSILFEMVNSISPSFYVIFLIISILATIIASQAMITAMFSVFFQMANINIFPRMYFSHTSKHLYGQIYSNFVNWSLFFCILFVFFTFKTSENIGHAYGLSVAITMLITSIFLSVLFYYKNEKFFLLLSTLTLFCDFAFVASSITKIPEGGYLSIIVASIVLLIIINYVLGQKKVYTSMEPIDFSEFEILFTNAYENSNKIKGTAVFLVRDYNKIPPYVVNVMFNQGIIYERNVFLSLIKKDEPFGIKYWFEKELIEGLDLFKIEFGYMEFLDVEKILNEVGINEKVIFYGIEDIITNNKFWMIYAFFKKVSPSFDKFYNLPSHKVHGIVTRIHI